MLCSQFIELVLLIIAYLAIEETKKNILWVKQLLNASSSCFCKAQCVRFGFVFFLACFANLFDVGIHASSFVFLCMTDSVTMSTIEL